MIIGICGKSGSGKSSLARMMMEKNNHIVHLDIDTIGHKVLLYPDVINKIIDAFGVKVISENKVDRKKLSKIVFNSNDEMEKLTNITWNYMEMEIDKFLRDNIKKVVLLDWLLLPKTKYFNMCNIKIFLDVFYDIRKERVKKRDNIQDESFELREKASIKYNKEDFDYVIDNVNSKSIEKLMKKLGI